MGCKLINTLTTVIDHITITAPSLETGAKLVQDSLGVSPQKGGEHPKMGTHNLFLRLGDSIFLEVIACNPNAKKPDRPRWFALDEIKHTTKAQLKTWVLRTNDIRTSVKNCTESIGDIEPMSRGERHWHITIPEDGSIPLNGGAPALIQWNKNDAHPATKLHDYGLSLLKLQIYHSEPEQLSKLLNAIQFNGDVKADVNVELIKADETRLVATIDTPQGIKILGN